MLTPDIDFSYKPPSHGWLTMTLGERVQFKLVFATKSEPSRGIEVLSTCGSAAQVLLPFWRFVREFQSHHFQEPHWRPTDYERIMLVKNKLRAPGSSLRTTQGHNF